MNRKDVLESALKLEEDGRDFYLEMASKAPNEYAQKTFESFAEDEKKHIEWLREISDPEANFTHSDRQEVSRIYGRLQSIFSGIPEEKRDGLASEEDDIILIDLAIDKEEESIQAYSEWADQAEDEEIRKLFAILVDFEKNHRKLLNNVKNYLESSGDWFMSEEQWIFDGG